MASAAPATSSTKETTNYARLCRLLVDVGTQALRDTFDAIHASANLHAVLANGETVLQSLRRRKIINATQWGKLFPVIRSKVSSRDLDITLLMVLLRNLSSLPSPINGWDTLPAATDMSHEADIARVKYFRNTVYAHAKQASVDDTTFNAHWQDIRDTLVRLGGDEYRAAIDNLETQCMDPEMEDHYKQLLSEWKKDEDNIKDVLKEIDTKVEDIMKKLDDLTAATVTNTQELSDEGKSLKLEELVEPSVMRREKRHENEALLCEKCRQAFGANNTKEDIKQAAEEQNLKMAELVKEMKVEIAEHMMQMEKTTERLETKGEKIAAAREKVFTTVEELIQVLREHENAMVTELDAIEIKHQRVCETQIKRFRNSATQLEASLEHWERTSQGNNSAEIFQAQQSVTEGCKGLLNVKKMNIFEPLDIHNKTIEEEIRNVTRAFLDEVIVLKVRIPSMQDLDTNTEDDEDGKCSNTNTTECDRHHDMVIEVNGQPLTSSPSSVDAKPHQYHAVRSFGSQGEAPGKFHLPRDIAINAKTGNIAVADAHNKRVQLFSSDGTYLKQYDRKGRAFKKLNHPISVAFNSAGVVTTLDSYRHIFCFTENGESVKDISTKHLIKPGDMTIACDDRMLVCDLNDKKVKVLSADGTVLLQSFCDPHCVVSPCVALCHKDNFFVSYTSAHCVKVYNSKGEFLYDIGKEEPGRLLHPVGLAVDKFNHLIVCDRKGGNVQVFTLEGKFVNSINGQPTQLQEPWAVAVSNDGQVFVTDTEKHCVHVIQ